MITTANGFWLSDPIPVLMAAGKSPIEAINAVITKGRVRTFTPCKMAVDKSNFCLRILWNSEMSNTSF